MNWKLSWSVVVTVFVLFVGAVAGGVNRYNALDSKVNVTADNQAKLILVVERNTLAVNKLDAYELQINGNSKLFESFLRRFDDYLSTQQYMNGELIRISTTQEAIKKELNR